LGSRDKIPEAGVESVPAGSEGVIRLAKFLARQGVASRRGAERIIASGRVTVNGQTVCDPATGVDDRARIEIDGEPLKRPGGSEFTYIAFHKPVGVTSTMSVGREKGPGLLDLVHLPVLVHPVGRLDRDSSGLLILTNDGDLTHHLTHPRHRVEKEYVLRVNRPWTGDALGRLERGVEIDGRRAEVDRLDLAAGGRIKITIHEGRKRILRRMMMALGYRVLELKRVRVGPICLGRLGVGKWRKLNQREIESIRKLRV
jgi:pseudouridine synthase